MDKYKIYVILGIVLVLLLIIIFASKSAILRLYNKYSKITNNAKIYGRDFADAARRQLKLDINLAVIDGVLTDCYSTKSKTLMMSDGTCNSNSLASIVIISHELGHAVQHKTKHPLLYLSNFLRKLTRILNFFIIPLFIASLVLFILGNDLSRTLFNLAITFFGLHTLSNLLLIPLEVGASRFAIKYLKENKYVNFNDVVRAKRLLRVASRTYIASFLDGILIFKLRFSRKKRRKIK